MRRRGGSSGSVKGLRADRRSRRKPGSSPASTAGLRQQVAALTRELKEAREQQTATSEVLQVISQSAGELESVFKAMLENATHICDASYGVMILNGFYAATKRKEADSDGYEPTLLASTRSLGDRVEIRVWDNGTGIPSEVKDKMFNPFFTTKPAGEGTGLGLSISHDIIVKQHDSLPGY